MKLRKSTTTTRICNLSTLIDGFLAQARPPHLPQLPPTFSSTATPSSPEAAQARVWPAFVSWLVPALLPHTRLLPDMLGAARAMWPLYVAPLQNGMVRTLVRT